MRTAVLTAALVVAVAGPSFGHGLLIPEDKKLPPLAMVYHRVQVAIEDQVAVTTVEQAFRNHTDRPLEATYVFPVPRGASARRWGGVSSVAAAMAAGRSGSASGSSTAEM